MFFIRVVPTRTVPTRTVLARVRLPRVALARVLLTRVALTRTVLARVALVRAVVMPRPGSAGRAAGAPHPADSTGKPAGVAQRLAEQILDLGVGAAQLVPGPPCKGVVHGGI
ncbi:hypothetical protein [Actinoplanes sp. NPDC026670]|uniref:hypothetical protein n=1 Tax=Actinoplanes sp. NPDC026670 TaxID=3154700 RepID=UPI0033D61D31